MSQFYYVDREINKVVDLLGGWSVEEIHSVHNFFFFFLTKNNLTYN